jgi:hypothetical protein
MNRPSGTTHLPSRPMYFKIIPDITVRASGRRAQGQIAAFSSCEPISRPQSLRRYATVTLSLRFCNYGKRGNLEKSGLRFSKKAFFPSLPSSVI